jgi:hypothetical protein
VKTYTVTLTVTDPGGLSSSATTKITVGSQPPQPTILQPPEGTKVTPGDVITFSGMATDPEDGNLPSSALHWSILLHHNTHIHDVLEINGSGGSFLVEDHDPLGTFSYEIRLTATDSSGLTNTVSRTLALNQTTAALSGKVIDARNGTGISGFTVSYSGGSTTTDSSGTYLFTTVAPGTYTVTATRTGWLSASGNVTVTAGTPAVLDLRTSTSGRASGQVTNSSGAAIAGATVAFQGGVLGINRSISTNSTGNFDTGFVAVGTYTFMVSATGNPSVQRTVTVSTGVTSTQNFTLGSTGTGTGTLQGKVTDVRNGAALAGATVSFGGFSTTTDASGNYQFTNVSAGTFNVTAQRSGYVARTLSVTVGAGSTTILNIPLSVSGKISGFVRTAAGAAISGATVTVSGGLISTTKNLTTSSTGFYDAGWIPIGTYTVTASKSGVGTKSATATVSTGVTTTVNFSF